MTWVVLWGHPIHDLVVAVFSVVLLARLDAPANDVLADPPADAPRLLRPYARRQGVALEDEMDLGQNKSITPPGISMGAQGRPIKRNAFRRFQKFLVRKRFKLAQE